MNDGFGLWKEYENEWFNEWNKLLNAGYCVIFIAHSEAREFTNPVTGAKYTQLYPKGDKRTIDLIIDAADFIGYVKSNGYDEEGNPQFSSVYFNACPEFLAGSRFTYMAKEITPFTAEGVQDAIKSAVEQEEANKGIEAVDYSTKQQMDNVPELTYEEAMAKIQPLFKKMVKLDKNRTVEIVEKYLGEGVKLSDTTETQIEQVLMILNDFEEILSEFE